ncbi:DUF3575 domain-containing protein [Tenacibaculum finnmarkense]|uniref:DUF3575 domain-containing protein n=1 Tax=Tenacibaculum finnmarkense TaxID=2781243 RepID=UPI001E28D805|nr:DUF3575 domain-containing protein [Tenacibaculum finnmarkense]MCD8411285.1 DUF3575 domain-containing protein [Tenacibaculum finnmarkense genomovar ulcerans]MCG8206520.1 DUF3575 domain-containing protein [Tenacibaculum finnmarkense genomovar finnmarkense]MCG8722564.1 DUF3575 domain-containing protein [Tenacibaculum finnmarkense]MCG8740888.1 DUF3575 domain-containing protein [Tenacibaculum finnmarkense]MCG8764221.1 DUF3575 domain-containing protein [Tenacibaculum finnmarkense]
MKKTLLIAVLFIGSFAQAQQEVKVDLLDALALKTVEVSYEYYTTERSSVGLSTLINFEKKSKDFRYNENWMITPYFRHYFTDNSNWNYFGEVFMGINGGEKEVDLVGSNKKEHEKYTDGALGLAIGSKYVSSGGFVLDVYAGLGRNMFTSKSPVVVPRVGINLGYRF